MRSSRTACAVGSIVLLAAAVAHAQQAQGFALERLYPSPAGAGWFVMDDLDLGGRLGGAMRFNLGYERNPLRISTGSSSLPVVSNQLAGSFGAAITYDRWRFSLDVGLPFLVTGDSGSVNGYSFTAPSLGPTYNPDPVSDVGLGAQVLVIGAPGGPFRFGLGGQLVVPSGNRSDYITDRTFRAMIRALLAGDVGSIAYAGHLGLHIRPVDDSPTPGSPRGSELLFGASAGPKVRIGASNEWVVCVGPEIFGATAFRALLGGSTTALEGLLSGRIEGGRGAGLQLRIKLGAGAGIHPDFGAEWRVIAGIEMFGRGRADGEARAP